MKRVTILFGWVCLIGSALAVVFAVFLLVAGGSAPTFGDEETPAGQSVRLIRPTTLWAKPASVELSTIDCTAQELGGTKSARLPLGRAPDGKVTVTSSGHGTLRYLTRSSSVGFTAGSVSCTGVGLSAIVTGRDSGEIHRAAGAAFMFAAPILLLLGLGVRRVAAGTEPPPRTRSRA